MKISKITFIAFVSVLSTSVQSALLERLDGLAFYDDETNLTWMADANSAVDSAYDTSYPGTGLLDWYDADAWVRSININGIGNWRLPNIDANGDGVIVDCFGGGVIGCEDNEIGFLYWEEGIRDTAPNPFSNVQSGYYWSETEFTRDPSIGWSFDFLFGVYGILDKDNDAHVWAVYDGDVSEVPIPSAVWLLSSGLIAFFGVARRRVKL